MTTICAYLIIAFFFFIEIRLRQGEAAKTRKTGESDRGSTARIGQAFAVMFIALLLSPIANHFGIGALNSDLLGWLAVVLMLAGLGLRIWASRTLGAFYTRTLVIQNEQRVVDTGPYKLVRNPGYLGDLVMFISAGIAVQNWIAFVLIAAFMISAYVYRIQTEEVMLQSTFGDSWTAYKTHTWRLVPLIY